MGTLTPKTKALRLMEFIEWEHKANWTEYKDVVVDIALPKFTTWLKHNLTYLPDDVRIVLNQYYMLDSSFENGAHANMLLRYGRVALYALYKKESRT